MSKLITIKCKCGAKIKSLYPQTTYCDDCKKERRREAKKRYRIKNEEKIKVYRKQTLEKQRVSQKKYRELNKDKIKNAKNKYLLENKDKIKSARKKHRVENKKKLNFETKKRYRDKNGSPEYWELKDLINQFKKEVENG